MMTRPIATLFIACIASTSITGTWTRPKLIAPVQIALGIGSHATYGRAAPRSPDHERAAGACHGRWSRAHAFKSRQVPLSRERLPQGRRHRLLPAHRPGD